MSEITTVPNPDLVVVEGNKAHWTHRDYRRRGLHNLHGIARYCMNFRAARVMPLEVRLDARIAELDSVRSLTAAPWFSAMVVIRGQRILFERYAPDFGPDRQHSIQSITKTMMNLVVGQLVDRGVLDLSKRVADYIQEIGSGYATATLQQVMNMDVVNEYSEDFSDPQATYYRHEEAMGWRLPRDPENEETQRSFLARLTSEDTTNRSGHVQYKDANTDVVGWVVERASGRPLRSFLADIADAAGLEGALYITTDREGFPTLDGGACMSARDLARYFSIFARWGRGVGGEPVGSPAFIERTLESGVPHPPPSQRRYSNHLRVSGRVVGHSGWGGQGAVANLDTGVVAAYLSAVDDAHGVDWNHQAAMVQMLETVAALQQAGS